MNGDQQFCTVGFLTEVGMSDAGRKGCSDARREHMLSASYNDSCISGDQVIVSTAPQGCGSRWHTSPGNSRQRHNSTGALVGVVRISRAVPPADPRHISSQAAASVVRTSGVVGCSTRADTDIPRAFAIRASVARLGLATAFSIATRTPLLTLARRTSWSSDNPRDRRAERSVRASDSASNSSICSFLRSSEYSKLASISCDLGLVA